LTARRRTSRTSRAHSKISSVRSPVSRRAEERTHLCSRSMMCPKYHSWMAFEQGFSSSRCTQRPRRPPTQMMPYLRDHMINATPHKCCADAFCFVVSTYLESPTRPVLFFLPTILFLQVASSSGLLLFHVVYCLYFFFVMREVQSRCIHHYHPASTPFVHLLCAIPTFTIFLYSPNPLGYLYPTRAYLLDTLE
jgi:hypothetical protein